MKILGICGSLRTASVNRMLLEIASGLMRDTEHEYEEFDLRKKELPLYNQDIEDAGLPEFVVELKQKIAEADILLIANPEYNHSISGVLKNAIDWGSRPFGENSFDGKRVFLMSASPGGAGGARGLKHLRESLTGGLSAQVEEMEVTIGNAYEAFNESGQFRDETNQKKVADLIGSI